jgi:TP901 family phage tail tape measure protein
MAGRFSVEAVFRAIDKISAPVSKMSNRIGKFSRRAQRSFRGLNSQVDKLGGGLRRVGVAGGAAMAGLGFAAANVIKTGADFEQQLTNAAAKFEAAAAKAGRTTEFTASQSAMALNNLAMAGFSAEQAISALPAVVNTATSAQIELEEASAIVVSTMGAFGKASKDNATFTKNLAETTDLMAATATSAATDFEEMQEAIKLSGPVATAAGADMKTFMAITGQLANSGIRASVAGTTMKNMFLKLAAPVPKAAKLRSTW